ncbi:MAG: porin family protein [Bacteroidota bacterium]|nr:porin family protein [Bacteroidota bacterium]
MNHLRQTKFLFFVIFVIFTTYKTTLGQLAVGIRGGYSHAWVDKVDTRNISNTKQENIDGFNLGATTEYAFNYFFALRMDIYYCQKGYKVTKTPTEQSPAQNTGGLGNDTWQVNMNYLMVPILPTLFYATKKYKFFAYSGPSVGYWGWGTKSGSFYVNDLGGNTIKVKSETENYPFIDNYNYGNQKDNRWDVGATIGAGMGILIKYGEIFIEGRYNHGFTDAIAFRGTPPPTHTPRYNRNVEINLGFRRMILKRKTRKKPVEEEEEFNYEGEY